MSKQISISDEIYERIKSRIGDTEFTDVDDYVQYILKQVVERLEGEAEKETPAYNEEDEKKVKERLKALGYMD